MSMGSPFNPSGPESQDDEYEEINVDITDKGEVWVHGEDWELILSPEEARQLGQALTDAAADAENPTE